MKISRQKNIFRIGLLMIFCELLLGLFICKWIWSQFEQEKSSLQKNILLQFTESKQEAIDSIILKNIVAPALNTKIRHGIIRKQDQNIVIDTLLPSSGNTVHRIIYTENENIPGDSFVSNNEKKITLQVKKDTSHHDLLLSGVKIVMDEIKGLPGEEGKIQQDIFSQTDTLLLKKLFDLKLKKNNLFFKTAWISPEKKGNENDYSYMYFDSRLYEKPYGAAIYHYNAYLIKKIFPEIAFAFILLLLTGFAFGISYYSMKKQYRLNILKDNFISNVSHELKTPVSTIKVAIEALQNFNALQNPKVTAEYLEMARLETKRLEQLIDQILNTSVLNSGQETMSVEKTDINTLIRETLTILKWKLDKQSAIVELSADEHAVLLNIDRLHIQGVLINLIDNSLKYNSGIPEITISTALSGNFFKLTIGDNGPGIPEEYIDKVFDRFFRVPNGDTHNVKGYGLGLTYAAQVMQQHKGSIEVKNSGQGGCLFTLLFPLSAG